MYHHMNNSVYYYLYALPAQRAMRLLLTWNKLRLGRQHVPDPALLPAPPYLALHRPGRAFTVRLLCPCGIS